MDTVMFTCTMVIMDITMDIMVTTRDQLKRYPNLKLLMDTMAIIVVISMVTIMDTIVIIIRGQLSLPITMAIAMGITDILMAIVHTTK